MSEGVGSVTGQAGRIEEKILAPAPEGAGAHIVRAVVEPAPSEVATLGGDQPAASLPPQVPKPATAPIAAVLPPRPSPEIQLQDPVSSPPIAPEGIDADDAQDFTEESLGTYDVPRPPKLGGWGKSRARRLVKPEEQKPAGTVTPEQKLLILDTWNRSGLPATEFARMVGIAKQALYTWKKRFEEEGPAGLMDRTRGVGKGSRLPEITKRTILLLKKSNPDWGCQRISDMLVRGPALPASPSAVARILHEAGYEMVEESTRPHPDHVRSFERAKPNQLWQTDLFVFNLKRQNRKVYLIAFLDDHSRFVVSYGLYGSSSTTLVLEVLNAGIASYGAPEEILTDNGPQYVVWRGKSAFSKELEKRGIKQIVAHPRRPQTLGKVERFWGTLWRECVENSIFLDIEDARKRIGLFIDHYNFQRAHQGVEGLVPADRFFQAAPDVLRTLKERVAANALQLARQGVPKAPFYLTGQIGGKGFSVHAEGERMILKRADGVREEIDMASPRAQEVLAEMPQKPTAQDLPEPVAPHGPSRGDPNEPGGEAPAAPGVSALDEGLKKIGAAGAEGGGA